MPQNGPSLDASASKPDKCSTRVQFAVLVLLVCAIALLFVYLIRNGEFKNRFSLGFDLLGVAAFTMSVLLIPQILFGAKKARLLILAGIVTFYLGSYTIFSMNGGYYFSQSGKLRYDSGLSVSDISIWHPQFLAWEPFVDIHGRHTSRGSPLGYYYSPLIFVDRCWFHPTTQLFKTVDKRIQWNAGQPQ